MFEWSQYFRDIQCMSGRRISATPGEIVVAEFLRHPVNEWSQSFCDTQCMSGRRISVTLSGHRIRAYFKYFFDYVFGR